MSVPAFFVARHLRDVARLYLIRRLGETFEGPIDEVLDFIARYRLTMLVASITMFAVVLVHELRQGKEELDALGDAIEEETAEDAESTSVVAVGPAGSDAGRRRREGPDVREGQAAPERLSVEVGTQAVTQVDRQRQAVADHHDRGLGRRPRRASATAERHPCRHRGVGLPTFGPLAAQVAMGHRPVARADPGPYRLPQPIVLDHLGGPDARRWRRRSRSPWAPCSIGEPHPVTDLEAVRPHRGRAPAWPRRGPHGGSDWSSRAGMAWRT